MTVSMNDLPEMILTHKHLSVHAQTAELKRVRDTVREMASPVLGTRAHLTALAVDEALANVILHGDVTDDIEIDIYVKVSSFEVRIVDNGPPYNPCQAPANDPAERAIQMQRGGMGMGIMRRVMDKIQYERLPDELNELRLIKYATGK